MPERVVVTGVGVVSPLGPLPAFWRGLCDGASGIAPVGASGIAPVGASAIAPIANAPAAPDEPRLEARVQGWQPREHIRPALIRRMDRCSQMLVSAARLALADAGCTLEGAAAESAGVVVGTAYGNLSESEDFLRGLFAKGPALANPLTFPNLVLNAPTGYIAIDLGIRGPNYTVVRGEASGEAALALAYDTIVSGQAELLLAGGGDELAPVLRQIYVDLGLLSPAAGGGEEWSSPFDRRRNGFVMGEGAALLVLERADAAARRGARVYAELVGHATESLRASPHDWPLAHDAREVRASATQLAELGFRARPADSALVVSCANSTPRLDHVENVRLAALLGAAAPATWVTSIKGAVGEFGAAGALGAAAAVMALASGDAPRLGRLEEPDTDSTLTLARRSVPPPAAGFTEALVHCVPRGGGAVSVLFRRA